MDRRFCPISQQRCKCLIQLFLGPLQPGFFLAGSPGGWGHSPEADRAGAAEGFGDGLQHHSEKVGPPSEPTGLPQGHHHSGRARDKVSAFQKQEWRSSKFKIRAVSAFPLHFLQSQRDFCNGTTAQQRCGWGKRPPMARGRWDCANYPERWELSSSHLGAPRTSTPTQLFLCFLSLELILHPIMELHSLLSR